MLITMNDIVYQKGEHSMFVQSGFIDYMAEVLKIRQLKAISAATIIDQFMALHN